MCVDVCDAVTVGQWVCFSFVVTFSLTFFLGSLVPSVDVAKGKVYGKATILLLTQLTQLVIRDRELERFNIGIILENFVGKFMKLWYLSALILE